MIINPYNLPEKWTEDMILGISDEDNRYEFKSGEPWLSNDLQTKLAKEICALANSFGGTLFIGIEDKTKEIIGVPTLAKGRENSKTWLENIIPNLLEFRLPNFRVLDVELDLNTKNKVGGDKTVISIDVYDSDLAPHRSAKDQIYYFRQGSRSVPAPHHYLAYLWGRTSPNMSNVVNSWFKLYLNDLVTVLEKTHQDFTANSYSQIELNIGFSNVRINNVKFFDDEKWQKLNSSLTSKQFLRTFPQIHNQKTILDGLLLSFHNSFSKLIEIINKSKEFETFIRQTYNRIMASLRYSTDEFSSKSFDQIFQLYAGEVLERIASGISHYPIETRQILVEMIGYNLLKINCRFDNIPEAPLFNLAKEIADQFDSTNLIVNETLNQLNILREEIAKMSGSLTKEIEELRFNLALKYNTTFE